MNYNPFDPVLNSIDKKMGLLFNDGSFIAEDGKYYVGVSAYANKGYIYIGKSVNNTLRIDRYIESRYNLVDDLKLIYSEYPISKGVFDMPLSWSSYILNTFPNSIIINRGPHKESEKLCDNLLVKHSIDITKIPSKAFRSLKLMVEAFLT